MINAVQLRMARAAVGWSLRELAQHAQVHLNTVQRCEAGYEMMAGTLQRLETVFKNAGIVFIEESEEFGPGVKIRRNFTHLQPPSKGNAGRKKRERVTKSKK